MKYFLGLDVGTTGCKAVLCDENGRPVGRGYRHNELLTPAPGIAEEDPARWWENSCAAIRDALSDAAVPVGQIAGVGVSCAGAMLAVDENGVPLTNAIMQMDQRAMPQMLRLRGEGASFSNPVTHGVSSLQTMLWLKEERPDLYARTAKLLMPNGYLVYKLTGHYAADPSRSSATLLMDLRTRAWDPALCERTGIDFEKLPPLYDSDRVVGGISPAAAAETGLAAGTPVISGMLDTGSAGVGVGAVREGDAYLVLGTFGKLCICGGEWLLGDNRFANFTYTQPGLFATFIVPDGGCGLSVNWFADTFGKTEAGTAKAEGRSVYSVLDDGAALVAPGSDGLIYLPFLSGGKSPDWDLNARGTFIGFTARHTRAHFFRAIMEGFAYSVRLNMTLFEQRHGRRIDNIRVSGGGAHSRVWLKILADVLDRRLVLVQNIDSEATGIAAVAANSVLGRTDYDWMPDWKIGEIVPDPAAVATYNRYFPAYRGLHSGLRAHFQALHDADMQ